MPRSIIEAMMSGLPVVASDIRGCREEVVDGETGLLVPAEDSARLKDALGRLIDDAALRQKMGSAGRERAAALYDEKRVIRRQLDLLGLTSGPAP
jgi:glycosyltransferase involved in cell wall biosynthesis